MSYTPTPIHSVAVPIYHIHSGISENKLTLGKGDIINAATALVLEALASTDSMLRCAAGEAVGRMAQVSDEAGFVSKIALMCFEKYIFYIFYVRACMWKIVHKLLMVL